MPHSRPIRNHRLLGERLEQLVATFDVSTITPDPLELVLRYADPLDQEIAGILAAAFAYGRADIVVRNVSAVLQKMGPSPHRYLQRFDRAAALVQFRSFAHRFHKTEDLVALLERLALVLSSHGSLGALFRSGYRESDADIGPALHRFVTGIIDVLPSTPRARASLQYLLTSPNDKSACKRMNLFLRWMVRSESPDLGLWDFVDPAKLVMPLDTHVFRIATFLGLSQRKSVDWRSARELTDRLARYAPADPVRYDFAICRLGILDRCSRQRRKEDCDACLLRDVCRFPVR